MNVNKHIFWLLLLLCYNFSTLLAQRPIITQSGSGNTQTNNINTNKEELDRIEKLQRQSIEKQDTLLLALKKNEEERAKIDSLHNRDIAQRDSIFYQALTILTKERERLLYESYMEKNTIESQKQQIEELKRIIQSQEKNSKFNPKSLVPSWVQFERGDKCKAHLFLWSEIVLIPSAAVSWSQYCKYKKLSETPSRNQSVYETNRDICLGLGIGTTALAVGFYVWNIIDGNTSNDKRTAFMPYATPNEYGFGLLLRF